MVSVCGAQLKHLRYDHRFMTQITSSAIWNGPSPDGYVSMLNRTNTAARTSQRTQEKMVRIFAVRLMSFRAGYPRVPYPSALRSARRIIWSVFWPCALCRSSRAPARWLALQARSNDRGLWQQGMQAVLEITLPDPAHVCITVNQLCTHPWAVRARFRVCWDGVHVVGCWGLDGVISFLVSQIKVLMQVKHPEWQKMLPRRNWCEVAPYEAEDGKADDPRAKGALVRLAPGGLVFRSRAARRAVAHGAQA